MSRSFVELLKNQHSPLVRIGAPTHARVSLHLDVCKYQVFFMVDSLSLQHGESFIIVYTLNWITRMLLC
jgi:hypothetical protein